MSWKDDLAINDVVVAGYFDEDACTLRPRAQGQSPNHPHRDDPDREAFDFPGSLELEPPADRLPRHPPADPATRGGTISYEAVLTAYTAQWPYAAKRFDYVDCKGQRWRIEAIENDGSGRPAFYLSRVRVANAVG